MPKSISRRTLLRGIGATLALPSLEIMGANSPAAGAKAPQRLICMFQPNGVFPKAWDVSSLGAGAELSPILSPLKSLLGDFSVIQGLDNKGRGHVQLTGSFLTGCSITNKRNGISLDQQVAKLVGGKTPLPSIILGTEPPRQGNASGEPIAYANTVSWSSETTRVSPEINPQVAFDRLFRSHSGPEAKRAALNRKSVIDLVLDDAKSLRNQVGKPDQEKLDEYLEAVRAVEVRVEKTLNPPERDWVPPTKPEKLQRPGPGIPKDRDAHLKLMIDLMVLAMWTDTTRVGTLMTAHGFSRQNFSFLDGVSSDHHGMSHHKNKPDAVAEYTTVSRWYVSQLAYLLEKMKSIDEGENSLLGNSVVMYGSGMKDGNGHVKDDLPLIVAGQGGGVFQQGQLLQNPKGTPHANLLLTLGQGLGLETDRFNGASTGVIDGLLA
ncbi:MAG: DUF1552 domain-containing protein [Verrucomicrobiales bacterium]|nr:DUF1552 domain-containing protein [Verrucomicrobiales bacterium]